MFGSYIFSDKTGTLTNNSMQFRKMSIAGTSWLHDLDIQEEAINEASRKPALQKRSSKGKKPIGRVFDTRTPGEAAAAQGKSPISCGTLGSRNSSIRARWRPSAKAYASKNEIDTAQLLKYIQHRPHTQFARYVYFGACPYPFCLPLKERIKSTITSSYLS